jgi:hypothetical protein
VELDSTEEVRSLKKLSTDPTEVVSELLIAI